MVSITSICKKVNDYFVKNQKIGNFFFIMFDYGSKLTHFLLFDFRGYFVFMFLLFSIPVIYSLEFIEFFVLILNNSPILFCFQKLPVLLQIVFLFYFFFLELVFICTLLAMIPFIKEKMVNKYKNPEILKFRGYNTISNSLRRATTLGFPIIAATVVAGDVTQHNISVSAIHEGNRQILEIYK